MIELGDCTQWFAEKLERLRYEYDIKPEDYIIDLGSYKREWADNIGGLVECFDVLDDRAAWIFDGEISFGGENNCTSQFSEPEQTCKCYDIAKFVHNVRLMKINIEGAEYAILNYLIDKDLLKEIQEIQVQFHIVDGDTERYEQLKKRMELTHHITWRYPFVWENWHVNI